MRQTASFLPSERNYSCLSVSRLCLLKRDYPTISMFIAVDMLGTKLNISALALLRRIMIAFANNSLNNENNS